MNFFTKLKLDKTKDHSQLLSLIKKNEKKQHKSLKLKIDPKPADIYLFKVNNGNSRIIFEFFSKLIIETLTRSQ